MATATAYDVAIVGGGFSGCMTLANLVRLAKRPLSIALIDASGRSPLGVAYSTPRMEHLLNVPAERMGAFADEPEGFFRWLQSAGHVFKPDDFAPRMLYGQYLRGVFDEALRTAQKRNITVTQIHAEIVDAMPGTPMTLLAKSGEKISASTVVLCCGNYFTAFAPTKGRYITDVWQYDRKLLADATPGLPVVLIGTGLTAVDVLCSLEKESWQGCIVALSRHGRFPMPHAQAPAPAWPKEAWDALKPPLRLSALFHAIREQMKLAAKQQIPWQSVMDSLRSHTSRLWQALPLIDQKRVFARYMTLWNIYRHRMPEPAERMISAMRQRGQLTIEPGRVVQVEEQATSVVVRYVAHGREGTLQAAAVFDCTGPRTQQLPPLIAKLVERRLAERSESGAGLNVDAKLQASPSVYVIGSMATGVLLESTAVPTLREQAQVVAAAIA